LRNEFIDAQGVAVEEMECLLDFMYKGSIDVAEENLPSLIKTATDLEIRGLSGEQKTQENSRNVYTRVETRTQRCHIETREIHTTEYIKDPSIIPFLPKHSSIDSIEDHIKVEEIEVEDDPMVIDSHEDSFDELPRSPETQIVSFLLPSFDLLALAQRGNSLAIVCRNASRLPCTSGRLGSKVRRGFPWAA